MTNLLPALLVSLLGAGSVAPTPPSAYAVSSDEVGTLGLRVGTQAVRDGATARLLTADGENVPARVVARRPAWKDRDGAIASAPGDDLDERTTPWASLTVGSSDRPADGCAGGHCVALIGDAVTAKVLAVSPLDDDALSARLHSISGKDPNRRVAKLERIALADGGDLVVGFVDSCWDWCQASVETGRHAYVFGPAPSRKLLQVEPDLGEVSLAFEAAGTTWLVDEYSVRRLEWRWDLDRFDGTKIVSTGRTLASGAD